MPIPLIATAAAAIGPALARHGLDLLASLFNGATKRGREELAELIEERTGIDVNEIAEEKLDEAGWGRLRELELAEQEQLLAFKQAEQAHALERQRLENAERSAARRGHDKELESEDIAVRRFRHNYAVLLTVLTFGFIFKAAFFTDYAADGPSLRIVDTVLGFLLGVSLSAIIQFFFGSSQGSASKQVRIDSILKDAAARTPQGGRDDVAR